MNSLNNNLSIFNNKNDNEQTSISGYNELKHSLHTEDKKKNESSLHNPSSTIFDKDLYMKLKDFYKMNSTDSDNFCQYKKEENEIDGENKIEGNNNINDIIKNNRKKEINVPKKKKNCEKTEAIEEYLSLKKRKVSSKKVTFALEDSPNEKTKAYERYSENNKMIDKDLKNNISIYTDMKKEETKETQIENEKNEEINRKNWNSVLCINENELGDLTSTENTKIVGVLNTKEVTEHYSNKNNNKENNEGDTKESMRTFPIDRCFKNTDNSNEMCNKGLEVKTENASSLSTTHVQKKDISSHNCNNINIDHIKNIYKKEDHKNAEICKTVIENRKIKGFNDIKPATNTKTTAYHLEIDINPREQEYMWEKNNNKEMQMDKIMEKKKIIKSIHEEILNLMNADTLSGMKNEEEMSGTLISSDETEKEKTGNNQKHIQKVIEAKHTVLRNAPFFNNSYGDTKKTNIQLYYDKNNNNNNDDKNNNNNNNNNINNFTFSLKDSSTDNIEDSHYLSSLLHNSLFMQNNNSQNIENVFKQKMISEKEKELKEKKKMDYLKTCVENLSTEIKQIEPYNKKNSCKDNDCDIYFLDKKKLKNEKIKDSLKKQNCESKKCLTTLETRKSSFFFSRNIKLIFEKEKKVLEARISNLEKFSYFKTVLSTYRENDKIRMSEHVNYQLSKILFSNNLLDKIKKKNFEKILKALDFFGYNYDSTFLKNLFDKIMLNEWLNDPYFFKKTFVKNSLNVGIFFDLVYKFLYMNKNFVNFIFTKNGGYFMKIFSEFDKNMAMRLINKLVEELKVISPSNNDVIDFLCGFFLEPTIKKIKNRKEVKENSKRKLNRKNRIKGNEELSYVHSLLLNLKRRKKISKKMFTALKKTANKNKYSEEKKEIGNEENSIFIKNKKYRASDLKSILSKVWLKTDYYVEEEMCYGPNFMRKKKKTDKKNKNTRKVNDFLYNDKNSVDVGSAIAHDSSDYTYFTDEERNAEYSKSDEKKINLSMYASNAVYNESQNDNTYGENGIHNIQNVEEEEGGQEQHDNLNNNNITDAGIEENFDEGDEEEEEEEENVTGNEEIEEESGVEEVLRNIQNKTRTFHSLEQLPNISFDLCSGLDSSHQRNDVSLSLCFKEEERCQKDQLLKNASSIGLQVSVKENKINCFNCFDVHLKIKVKKNVLCDINYYISDEEKVSAFFPIWPNNPDFFGFKISKNIKKDFYKMKKGKLEKKGFANATWNMNTYKANKNAYNRIDRCDLEKKGDYMIKRNCNNINTALEKTGSRFHLDNEENHNAREDVQIEKIDMDEIKIRDCSFSLGIKLYPFRTLLLYVLYNLIHKEHNFSVVDFISRSLTKEIKEWLLLFLIPNFINKSIHKVVYPLKLTKSIFTESNEFYEDFFSNEYSKINDIEKIIIYTKNDNEEDVEICPFFFTYLWLKSCNYKIDKWISSKLNETLFTFPYANFLLSKYFSNFLLFIKLFKTCLDADHVYLCKSHLYVSLKHNISFLHESMINVLFAASSQLNNI